ncbi:MAG: DUF1328 domain-containing protein [Persicimonas sp.]
MVRWALVFLVIAIISAVFGFGGPAGTGAGIAQLLFFLCVTTFVVLIIMGMLRESAY